MSQNVRIMMDDKATEDEKETAKQILEEAGLTAELDKRVYIRKSFDSLAWLIIIYTPLVPFFDAFLEAAGKDAWSAFKKVITRLRESRKDPNNIGGAIKIQDKKNDVEVWIEQPEMSEEAVHSLLKIDFSLLKPGIIVWDEEKKKWTNREKRI